MGPWTTGRDDRYDSMEYRYTGKSGLKLPALSLGLWQNFGTDRPEETQRAILRRAFDRGVTHFDLANNYGPPYGRAEENFGVYLRDDFADLRDELVISTKAGYDMWPGPYGQGGGSRKYVLSSLDQSLARMGLDYVDIFYSHRFDAETPVEETMTALDTAVRSGRALYVGISSYSPAKTREAAPIARELGHAAADPPAVVLDAQPLDRAGPPRRARGAGHGLHRVHRAGPGRCSPTATSTASRRTRGRPAPTARSRGTTSTTRPSPRARPQRDRRRSVVRSSRSWPCSGPCATSASPRRSSGRRRSSSSTPTSTRWTSRRSPTRSWPASTRTPWTAGVNLWAESSRGLSPRGPAHFTWSRGQRRPRRRCRRCCAGSPRRSRSRCRSAG